MGKLCTDQRIQTFFQRQASLSEVDGCLLSEYMIAPSKLHERVIKQFHQSHQGISHIKALACSFAYWPDMDKRLEELTWTYFNSSKFSQKNALSLWPIPKSPWSYLHI